MSSLGNILIKQKTSDLVICPTIDKDRVLCYEIERADESTFPVERRHLIKGQTHLYIQSALLYSTAEGERRIRVHNACIPLTNIRHLPFDYIDSTAVAFYFARSSLARLSLNSFNFQSAQSSLELQM